MMENGVVLAFSGIRPGEAARVVELVSACGLDAEDLSEAMLRNFIAARLGPDIIGVVGLEIVGGEALLRSLAVDGRHRRQGVARGLIESVERYARSQSVTALFLLTMTAEGFFTTLGYRPQARDRVPAGIAATGEFSTLCPASAVCLGKSLG